MRMWPATWHTIGSLEGQWSVTNGRLELKEYSGLVMQISVSDRTEIEPELCVYVVVVTRGVWLQCNGLLVLASALYSFHALVVGVEYRLIDRDQRKCKADLLMINCSAHSSVLITIWWHKSAVQLDTWSKRVWVDMEIYLLLLSSVIYMTAE